MNTSIPFEGLFQYTGSMHDLCNSHGGVDMRASMFGLHLRCWAEQLLRVMMPGRVACIHIQQLLRFANTHGYAGRRDFRGAVVDVICSAGFEWKGEVVIPKNPQVQAQRLKLHSLLFITGRKDSCDLAPSPNDYLMIFRKPGDNPVPVPALYDRRKNPDGWMTTNEWIRWARGAWHDISEKFGEDESKIEGYEEAATAVAKLEAQFSLISGIWSDIRESDVLNNFQEGRQDEDEKHVCPLQLEVIRRCVKLYTNPGELVLDPFMGIGSCAYVAIEQGRRAVGFELKESYHKVALRNAERAKALGQAGGLFEEALA